MQRVHVVDFGRQEGRDRPEELRAEIPGVPRPFDRLLAGAENGALLKIGWRSEIGRRLGESGVLLDTGVCEKTATAGGEVRSCR